LGVIGGARVSEKDRGAEKAETVEETPEHPPPPFFETPAAGPLIPKSNPQPWFDPGGLLAIIARR
jgi:hypothetical protein